MTNSNNGILIIGGTSDIGREIGVRLCRGRQVVLAARRAPDLQPFYDAGATKVHILYFEAPTCVPTGRFSNRPSSLRGRSTWFLSHSACWVISNGQKSTSFMRRT